MSLISEIETGKGKTSHQLCTAGGTGKVGIRSRTYPDPCFSAQDLKMNGSQKDDD